MKEQDKNRKEKITNINAELVCKTPGCGWKKNGKFPYLLQPEKYRFAEKDIEPTALTEQAWAHHHETGIDKGGMEGHNTMDLYSRKKRIAKIYIHHGAVQINPFEDAWWVPSPDILDLIVE